jgi:cardiolipin synthase
MAMDDVDGSARRAAPAPTRPPSDPEAVRPLRQAAEQALSRTSGAPLIDGNRVTILRDATENYPAWLRAIRAAKRAVLLENYIFDDDAVGGEFAEALMERAAAGVAVRVLRDWLGTTGGARRRFWRRMIGAGVEVRCFNPPRLDSPLGWLSRDHRKMVAVDGDLAFVSGLCISSKWQGDPARGIPPWRDTGLEIRGPAVADIHAAFAQTWETAGDPLPDGEHRPPSDLARAGDVAVRVLAGVPGNAGLLRTDQFLAALARRSLWLTDAYFVGVTPYVQALRAAARDGVDVRLLIPSVSDLNVVRAFSRAGYRSLLEAGVRVFEWNGSMLHAKTSVVDGRWSRVGSSNLNLASFLGNYELDVAVDDVGVASAMEEMYRQDLENATEIVLARNRIVEAASRAPRLHAVGDASRAAGSSGRGRSTAAAGAMRVANAVGASLANRRVLGPAEARLLAYGGLTAAVIGALALFFPRLITVPLAVVSLWIGAALSWRAARLRSAARPSKPATPTVERFSDTDGGLPRSGA